MLINLTRLELLLLLLLLGDQLHSSWLYFSFEGYCLAKGDAVYLDSYVS